MKQQVNIVRNRPSGAQIGKDVARHVVLTLLAVFWLIPIVWLVVSSFGIDKGPNIRQFFPMGWTLDNYKALLFGTDTVSQFPRWFLNTFIIACFTCFVF